MKVTKNYPWESLFKNLNFNMLSSSGAVKGKAFFDERPLLCEMTASLCIMTCICAFLNLTVISLSRYIRVCWNSGNFYYKIFTRKTCTTMCVLVSTSQYLSASVFFCFFLVFFCWGGCMGVGVSILLAPSTTPPPNHALCSFQLFAITPLWTPL